MTQTSTEGPPTTDAGAWGPTMRGGRRRRRWLRWLFLMVLVVVLAVVLTGVAAAFYASSQIERMEVAGTDGGGGPLQILVVGSDSREGLTEQEQLELTTGGDLGSERTDTIFLLTVEGGDAAILAFPRDLYVPRCDGTEGRINVAQQIGGPGCLVQTVEAVSSIPVDHYMAVSFTGFRDIVNAVGGVEICLEQAIQDPFAGIDLPAGCQILNGREALGYARTRKIDNDLERIKRQQRFLSALADRVVSPATILNPVKLFRTAGQIGEALQADHGFGIIELARMGWGARSLAAGAAITETVPTTPATRGGAAVLLPTEEAPTVFAQFRDGSILDQAAPDARGSVPIEVYNGAGVSGLASRTAEALETAGWTVAEIGNTEPRQETVIQFPPGQEAAAEALRSDLPVEARLEESAEVANLVLLLGEDLAS